MRSGKSRIRRPMNRRHRCRGCSSVPRCSVSDDHLVGAKQRRSGGHDDEGYYDGEPEERRLDRGPPEGDPHADHRERQPKVTGKKQPGDGLGTIRRFGNGYDRARTSLENRASAGAHDRTPDREGGQARRREPRREDNQGDKAISGMTLNEIDC
jgi:hypothetical protein